MILDEIEKIKRLDKSNLLGSIELLPEQCRQTWEEVKEIKIPDTYRQVSNIVVNGMGGSGLGPHVVKSVFSDSLRIPLEVINSYTLPGYVDKNTLLILSSYSGTTEEVWETGEEALKRGAKCLGITTGEKLGEFLDSNNIPYFKIIPKHNPCGQPRMGLGYTILGIIGLINQCGLIKIEDEEINLLIETLREINYLYLAKKIAQKIFGKITILVAAEFLAGSIHTWQNQQHEVAKNYGNYFLISELNHHLLEGMGNPKSNPKNLISFFANSKLYHQAIRKRFLITKDVFKKNKIEVVEFECQSASKLLQAFELIHFGSYVNFYLAMLNNIDPTPTPWVNLFKEQLEK